MTYNQKLCECDLLKEDSEGFEKIDDFYDFQKQVQHNGLFERIYGEKSLEGELPNEKFENWFQCTKCRAKWCLCLPDLFYNMGDWVKATWRK